MPDKKEKLPRVVVEYPVGDTTPSVFVGTARLRGSNATKLLKAFISEYLAQGTVGIQEDLSEPIDPYEELLEKAREMLEKGGRAAQSMEDAILGSYAIHRRKSK